MDEIRKVGIIGGGMGGLLLAQLIQKQCRESVEVIVYERDETKESREQGYILGIDETGMKALQKVLPDIYNERCIEASKGFNLTNSQLKRWLKFDIAPGMGISRRKLRNLLIDGVNNIQFGKKFKSCEESKDTVIATFEDGTTSEKLDLLVGADGCRSRVRALRIPQLKYEPIGVVSITGAANVNPIDVPTLFNLLEGGFTRAFGSNGSSILMMIFNDEVPGQILWVITIPTNRYPLFPKSDQEFDVHLLYEWSKDHVLTHNYHKDIQLIVTSTDPSTLYTSRELHSMIPLKGVNPLAPSSRVTLLGDAAHSMTTHRGRGVNTTFDDCVDLADFIEFASRNKDWMPALYNYEKILFKRGFKNVADSKQSTEMITMTGLWASFRNFIICFIGFILYVRSFIQ